MDSEWRFNPPCPLRTNVAASLGPGSGTADPVVRTAITTDDLPALHRHIAVVGQVLVDHRHGEIREGAVAIPRHRIEQSESRPALGAASDFRGVQELFSIADPPAVEGAGLVEQLGALREELAVLIEPDLAGLRFSTRLSATTCPKSGTRVMSNVNASPMPTFMSSPPLTRVTDSDPSVSR